MKDYLMNIASILFFICYVPEFYANIKNKNANIYNVPEKVAIFIASSFALSYAMQNNNNSLIINYAPILTLDGIALLMRLYYAYKNFYYPEHLKNINNHVSSKIIIYKDIENPMHNLN